MALFQIAEPDAQPPGRERKRAVGIDLGTTNSLVATVLDRALALASRGLRIGLRDLEQRHASARLVECGQHRLDVRRDLGEKAQLTHGVARRLGGFLLEQHRELLFEETDRELRVRLVERVDAA